VYLGVQLAVAYCLGDRALAIKPKIQTLWRIVTAIVISLGLWCCFQIVLSPTWWNKYSSYYNPQVAQIINEYPNPLIISHSRRISRVTSLSYMLDAGTKFILLERDTDFPAASLTGFENIFLFRPYPELIERAREHPQYRVKSLSPKGHLWQVIRQ
jgi:hypothetical protein